MVRRNIPRRSARPTVMREALVAGSFASAFSALALIWAGHHEIHSSTAPLNAVSHWRWGRSALHKRGFTRRHTALGYVIHHCASIWWAAMHAAVMQRRANAHKPVTVAAGALATSAVACVVDFKCTPERLTPGFEHHLSRQALVGVYAMFGMGLAFGAWLSRAARPRHK